MWTSRMTRMKMINLAVVVLLLVGVTRSQDNGRLNTDCDVSETAMNDKLPGVDIPRRCIMDFVNNRRRCFYTHVPACASGSTPLVYDLHGFRSCPTSIADYSGWLQLSTSECFVVVWPIGNTNPDVNSDICWAVPGGLTDPTDSTKSTASCCCGGTAEALQVGDLDVMRGIGKSVADQLSVFTSGAIEIDPRRIYMTGHSNGCYAVFGMAMMQSDFIAGVACFAGYWVTPPAADYTPTPIWAIMGESDTIVSIEGIDAEGSYAPSFGATFLEFSELNGCTEQSEEVLAIPEMNTFFETGQLTTRTSTGCSDDATVQFLSLSTGGHSPYALALEFAPPRPYAVSTTIDTTALAWDFLSSHQLTEIPLEFQPTPSPPPTALFPTEAPEPSDNTTFAIVAVDSSLLEGDTGTTAFSFTVTRSGVATGVSSVDYAIAGDVVESDFVDGTLLTGTLTFEDGVAVQSITVEVNGDTDVELDETFTVMISNAANGATITTATATATIENDDTNQEACTNEKDCVDNGVGFACDSGTCVPCLTNIQCSSNTGDDMLFCLTCADMGMQEGCNASDHVCVDCTSNRICLDAGRGRACVDNTCVGCSSNWQCKNRGDYEGDYCVGNECVECKSNRQCSDLRPYCVDNTCIECKRNGQCSGSAVGPNCVGNTCVECKSNGQCRNAGTGLACLNNACVGCTTNWQCRSIPDNGLNTCVDNNCIA